MRHVARQEKKYLVDTVTAAKLQHALAQVLASDPHNGNGAGGYSIRSLYFDTPHNRDFVDKINGVGKRQKVRMRAYGPRFDTCFMELKQKDGDNQLKRSLPLDRVLAQRIIAGDYSGLCDLDDPFAAELHAFMIAESYRPRAVIEYDRTAFIARENNTRIIFDRNVRANEANMNMLDARLCLYPVLNPFNTVLEVKYSGFLLSYVRSILNQADKSELSVSKYCLGRTVSMAYQF